MRCTQPRQVTIIGVGLLGGSAGLALKARCPRARVCGVGRRKASLDKALEVGAIDAAYLEAAEPAADSDLVILATPVGAFAVYLRAVAPVLKDSAIVTDVGSTKGAVVRIAGEILGPRGPFVGSHPMAGSEQKGPAFARADLFDGATCIVTPTPRTPPAAVRRVEAFWRMLGMRTVRMKPADHDRVLAKVSHLPHVLASLLVMLPDRKALDAAATGFRDMTRLAAGDPEVWRDVLLTNRREILRAIDRFDESLVGLRDLLELPDVVGLERFLAAARHRRRGTIGRRLTDPSDSTG